MLLRSTGKVPRGAPWATVAAEAEGVGSGLGWGWGWEGPALAWCPAPLPQMLDTHRGQAACANDRVSRLQSWLSGLLVSRSLS